MYYPSHSATFPSTPMSKGFGMLVLQCMFIMFILQGFTQHHKDTCNPPPVQCRVCPLPCFHNRRIAEIQRHRRKDINLAHSDSQMLNDGSGNKRSTMITMDPLKLADKTFSKGD
jgi:hypothetical protein